MNTSITSGQNIKFLELLEQKKGQKKMDPDKFQKILASGLLSDLMEANIDLVVRDEYRKSLGLSPKNLSIVVDYSLTLAHMINLGEYDSVNSDIADNFKVSGNIGKKELKAEIVHFNRYISSEKAIKEMGKMGLRPTTLEELLAFGAAYPEIQRKFPVVALGSSCELRGGRCVPCLRECDSVRRLGLRYWVGDWNARCHFFAVPK